jgi:hypothetical protein
MMSEFIYEDTFAPNWPDDQRVPYALIMLRLSERCKHYCQSKLKGLLNPAAKGPTGWRPNENGLAWAYEQVECAYSFPIEELMLEVASMILDGGRSFESEQWMNYHRAKIQAILQKNDLQAMLAELPQPERDYFESDLKLLEPLGLFGSWQG